MLFSTSGVVGQGRITVCGARRDEAVMPRCTVCHCADPKGNGQKLRDISCDHPHTAGVAKSVTVFGATLQPESHCVSAALAGLKKGSVMASRVASAVASSRPEPSHRFRYTIMLLRVKRLVLWGPIGCSGTPLGTDLDLNVHKMHSL